MGMHKVLFEKESSISDSGIFKTRWRSFLAKYFYVQTPANFKPCNSGLQPRDFHLNICYWSGLALFSIKKLHIWLLLPVSISIFTYSMCACLTSLRSVNAKTSMHCKKVIRDWQSKCFLGLNTLLRIFLKATADQASTSTTLALKVFPNSVCKLSYLLHFIVSSLC